MWVRFPSGAFGCVHMEDNMKDFLDKVKNVFSEKVVPVLKNVWEKVKSLVDKIKPFIMEKAVPFVIKHKRYFATAGLFICFVVILVFFTGEEFNSKRIAKINSREVSGEDYVPDAEFEVNAYAELNELVQTYFDAYVNADFQTLETIAYPISDMEKSYITTMSQFYEAYQNLNCYTKHGLSKDSYIVSARFDIKFAGVETTAPSMVLFYVQTDENGVLYINNLYSDFNMQYAEEPISQDVYTALRKYTTEDDYLELYNEVESAFNSLIKENTEIQQLTKRTIPGTRQQWEDSVYYVQQDTETEQSTQVAETPQEPETPVEDTPVEETPAEEQTPEEEEAEPAEEKIKIVNTSTNVNIREEADGDSDDIGDAYKGEEFVKLGEEEGDDGHTWIKIRFDDDKEGYVRSDFTEEVTE